MNSEYKKTLEDEIDWKLIDQLHVATVNFSSTSLELKKLFFVLIGIAVPILIKLAKEKIDFSLFVTLYLLSFSFWFLDSFTYFYQEKLRDRMNSIFTRIKLRNDEKKIVSVSMSSSSEEFTIEANRTVNGRALRSIWNPSVKFYLVVILLNSVAFLLFLLGKIK